MNVYPLLISCNWRFLSFYWSYYKVLDVVIVCEIIKLLCEIIKLLQRLLFADYLDKMHRPGNKLILVYGIELPEMSIQNASKWFNLDLCFGGWCDDWGNCCTLVVEMLLLITPIVSWGILVEFNCCRAVHTLYSRVSVFCFVCCYVVMWCTLSVVITCKFLSGPVNCYQALEFLVL